MVLRVLKNIGLQILLLGLTLLMGELICRAYLIVRYRSPRVMYQKFGYDREPLLGFDMIADVEETFLPGVQTTYSTNSQGFRGKTEFGTKAPGEFRIVILGGSSAFGFGASSDEATIASRLQETLERRYPSRTFSVINAGNPGYVSYQVLAKLQLKVLDLEPDLLVLYMGWNDLFFSSHRIPFKKNSFYGKHQYFEMDSWQRFITHHNRGFPYRFARPFALTLIVRRAYLTFTKHPEAEIERHSLISSDELGEKIHGQFYDNLSSIVAIARYRKIQTILITLFSEYDLFPADRSGLNEVIRRVARESGSRLIDADERVMSHRFRGINNERDHYHLSDRGNEYLAGLIAEEIADILSGDDGAVYGREGPGRQGHLSVDTTSPGTARHAAALGAQVVRPCTRE